MANDEDEYDFDAIEQATGQAPVEPGQKRVAPEHEDYDFDKIGPFTPMSAAQPQTAEQKQPLDYYDIAKGAGQGVGRGAADIAGMPRDISGAMSAVGDWVGKKKEDIWDRGLMGRTDEQIAAKAAEDKAAQEALDNTWIGRNLNIPSPREAINKYWPSSDQIKEKVDPYLPEPKTDAGKFASGAAELGTSVAPGGGGALGAAGRFASGVLAKGAGETVGQYLEDKQKGSWAEPWMKPATEVTSLLLTQGLGGAAKKLSPGAAASSAESAIFDAYRKDLTNGAQRMTPAQIQEAVKNGTPVTLLDAGGPEVKKLVASSASESEKAQNALAGYNETAKANGSAPRIPEAVERSQNHIVENINGGRPVDAPAMLALKDAESKKNIDAVYQLARENPAAKAIPASELGDIVNTPIMKEAMEKARRTALNDTSKTPTIPRLIPEVPATESKWVQTPRGMVEVPGTPAQTAHETPGDLSFWDHTKRNIDDQIATALQSNNKYNAGQLLDIKNKLVDQLDKRVPEYAKARGAAAEAFGAATMPEAGIEYFRKSINANAGTIFDRAELSQKLASATPEQKALFQQGFIHSIHNELGQNNGLSRVSKAMIDNQNFANSARQVMGTQAFNELRGKIVSENIVANANSLPVGSNHNFAMSVGKTAAAGLLPAAMDLAAQAAFQTQLLPSGVVALGLAGSAYAGTKAALDMRHYRNTAAALVPLVTDPKNAARLSQVIDRNPVAVQILSRMTTINNEGPLIREGADRDEETPPPIKRANGGRIGGARLKAARLVSLADSMKNKTNQESKPLLQMGDGAIAKALAITSGKI